jgi:hypothetical protein
VELPWFGAFNHENVVPVAGLSEAAVFLPEDPWRDRTQAYAYFTSSLADAIVGKGKLAAFVPREPGDGDPSANDLAIGDRVPGRFVAIPDAEVYDGRELDAFTEAMGAFSFVRFEDAVADLSAPGVVYVADTGSFAETSEVRNGRLYRFTFDPAVPRRAVLEVILDGDDGDRILNPDNLGIGGTTLMIQENHNDEDSRAARVWAYDLTTGSLRAVAKTDPTVGAVTRGGGRGVWESSGIVDVSDVFGDGTWLLDVQAHRTAVAQQGLDLQIDSGKGSGGQLLLMTVPGT